MSFKPKTTSHQETNSLTAKQELQEANILQLLKTLTHTYNYKNRRLQTYASIAFKANGRVFFTWKT